MKETLIIALGGNALIKEGQKNGPEEEIENLKKPLGQIVRLSEDYNIVITHGNGPQVGNLMLQQHSSQEARELPLDVLVSMTQGEIGYIIEKTLENEFKKTDIKRPLLSTLITYVEVSDDDPSFENPTKPVGPAYEERKDGFIKTNKGWRKAVPSPEPKKIVDFNKVKKLLEDGFIVIACGGGGVPVKEGDNGYKGVEAVIDKDLASSKLGEEIEADVLLIATDVEGVYLNYGKENEGLLEEMTIGEARKYKKNEEFPAGSMGPKVKAAVNFIESGGDKAIICRLEDIEKALEGKEGTQIVK